ncbi:MULTISPECIES: hypothetical protein [unclassified Acinetobacter]|uniref:hypothetical protein n=1 Tax=unclassified Acinetobacter TaxID=196816 RepID=UPI001C23AA25|nr:MULTISPECIES: hypothetical protein [unclassified Acinetobacter]
MNYIDVIDTAIKISLGALITGVIAYLNQKANISAATTKDKLQFNRNLLTQISTDIEEINHLILKMWSIFDFETKKSINNEKVYERLDPLRGSLFNDFNLLSKNEGLLLLHGYNEQQEKLRFYGELLGKFNTYTLFKSEEVRPETTAQYRIKILEARKELYKSLNKVIY